MLKTVSSVINAIGALNFKGTWNASTNTPTLASSVGVKGDYYYVSVAGNTDLNGITDWQVTDLAVFNGSVWQKIDNTDQVVSVNGQIGAVVLTAANVNAVADTATITAGTGLTGGGTLASNTTVSLTNTAVTPATYGGGTNAAEVTVDAQGRITAAANVAIPQGTVTNVATGTGLTGGPITSTGTIELANTTVTAGTYGGNTTVAVVVVDAQGRLTSASNVAIDFAGALPDPLVVNNLEAANVTVTANLFANLATSNSAAMPDPSLPLNPEGYVEIVVNGTTKKVPYYGV